MRIIIIVYYASKVAEPSTL